MVLRHAKSSWADESIRDHDRPLNPRGRDAAAQMARFMMQRDLLPELILSSDSTRTRETIAIWSKAANWEGDVEFRARLYHASSGTLLDAARSAPDTVEDVMLVAHNPGIEDLVSRVGSRPIEIPTAALAVFDLDCGSWSQADPESMSLALLQRPRELAD